MLRRRHRLPRAAVLALVTLVVGACGSGTEETAVFRGDIAFARDSLEEALAEYRLAVVQGSDDANVLARIGHTYVRLGRVDDARDYYGRAIAKDSAIADEAAADLVHLARSAADRDDRFQMASAMTAALEFRPGLSVQEMALPLARHYYQAGEYGRALPFYQRALAARSDSAPELVFEIGQAHEEIGDCTRALVFFERFRDMVEPWERGEVDWFIGSCSFQRARESRQEARGLVQEAGRGRLPPEAEGLLEDALRFVNRTLQMGEPKNLQGQALFEKGEILADLGDCSGALEAFEAVRWAEPTPNTALARRAQERYDQIRFSRGLEQLLTTGRCG